MRQEFNSLKKSGRARWLGESTSAPKHQVSSRFIFFFSFGFLLSLQTGCALFQTRPVQNMANTHAALRAAKEVQADVLAPELYRQAAEWFHRAREEYKMKNFSEANQYSDKARAYAERAEFEAIRNGANRQGVESLDPLAEEPPPPPPRRYEPNVYATPTGTPIEQFDAPGAGDTPPAKP